MFSSCDVPRPVKRDGSAAVAAVATAGATGAAAGAVLGAAAGAAGAGVADAGRRRVLAAGVGPAGKGKAVRSKLICKPSTSDKHPTQASLQLVCAQARHPCLQALPPRSFSWESSRHTCTICLRSIRGERETKDKRYEIKRS